MAKGNKGKKRSSQKTKEKQGSEQANNDLDFLDSQIALANAERALANAEGIKLPIIKEQMLNKGKLKQRLCEHHQRI